MNARYLVMVVLLLGLIPWVVFSINCGLGGDPLEKMSTYTAGGGGGGDSDGPGDNPPGDDDPIPPSQDTIDFVIAAIVDVSDQVSDPSEVHLGDTLWDLGIRTLDQIIAFADALDIPPSVWAEYKAEKLTYQITDEWSFWCSLDPDLEAFIYGMTIYEVAEMAEGYAN